MCSALASQLRYHTSGNLTEPAFRQGRLIKSQCLSWNSQPAPSIRYMWPSTLSLILQWLSSFEMSHGSVRQLMSLQVFINVGHLFPKPSKILRDTFRLFTKQGNEYLYNKSQAEINSRDSNFVCSLLGEFCLFPPGGMRTHKVLLSFASSWMQIMNFTESLELMLALPEVSLSSVTEKHL